jgi:hypothetical protein
MPASSVLVRVPDRGELVVVHKAPLNQAKVRADNGFSARVNELM